MRDRRILECTAEVLGWVAMVEASIIKTLTEVVNLTLIINIIITRTPNLFLALTLESHLPNRIISMISRVILEINASYSGET